MDVTIIKLKPGTKANKLKFSVNCVDPIPLIVKYLSDIPLEVRNFLKIQSNILPIHALPCISQKLSEQLVQKLKSYIQFLFKSQICLIKIMAWENFFLLHNGFGS